MKRPFFSRLGVAGGLTLILSCASGPDPSVSDLGSGGSAASNSGGATGASSGDGGLSGTGASMHPSGGADVGAGGVGAGGVGTGGAGAGGVGTGGAVAWSPLALGMNDVTIVVPLPERVAEPVLLLGSDRADDSTPLVPRALFDHLTADSTRSILADDAYDRLQLVAVRFDLCDHTAPGPCPLSGDASLRLIFQPLRDELGAEDVGFHAFYSIAEAEIPVALQTLGELSALRNGPAEPLAPSATLAEGKVEYVEKLRAFVRASAGEQRLIRLTMNAQPLIFSSITWLFRGVERRGTQFEDLSISGTTETTQQVTLVGEGFFLVNPMSDTPPGLARALDRTQFEAASDEEKRAALEALVAADNPLTNSTDTIACPACHTSTVALASRAKDMGLDPATLPGSYETSFDVSVEAGMSKTNDQTLRALGFLGRKVMISQRVANDTALVLEDIERRFQ